MSSIESASAAIPATYARALAPRAPAGRTPTSRSSSPARWARAISGVRRAWVSRFGSSNTASVRAGLAYTLTIYTHPSTGKDRAATENVAGVLLGSAWMCIGCSGAFIGTAPESGRCKACTDNDGAAGMMVPALFQG